MFTGLSRHFHEISLEFCLCVSLFSPRKRQDINKLFFDRHPFPGTILKKLFVFMGFSPPIHDAKWGITPICLFCRDSIAGCRSDNISAPNMAGRRLHCTTEAIPRHPWKAKSPFASRPIQISVEKDTRGVRTRYDTVLLPFVSIVRCPCRPIIEAQQLTQNREIPKKGRAYANFFEKFARTFAFPPVTQVRNPTEIVQKNLFR